MEGPKKRRRDDSQRMFEVGGIHHVSLPVRNLERSRRFYGTTLGLTELERPPSDNRGAWYRVGENQLHLIEDDSATFRENKKVDDQDVHFAIKVDSSDEARRHLRAKGFHPEADDELKRTMESIENAAGRSRVFVMDPDRNVIELST